MDMSNTRAYICVLFIEVKLFLCYIFSYFWIYVCLLVFFPSLFSFFKIFRFLLFTATIILNILLSNICIKLACTNAVFGIYFTQVPINDVTYRVLIIP